MKPKVMTRMPIIPHEGVNDSTARPSFVQAAVGPVGPALVLSIVRRLHYGRTGHSLASFMLVISISGLGLCTYMHTHYTHPSHYKRQYTWIGR